MNVLIILFPHQLFSINYIKKISEYYDDSTIKPVKIFIILWEHNYFFREFPYHKMKLAFHRASMKNYYDILKKTYNCEYIENIEKSHEKIIVNFIKKNNIEQIRLFNPIEKKLNELVDKSKLLGNFPIEYLKFPTPYFLNSSNPEINLKIKNKLTSTRHDIFYKIQRIEYDIMVKHDEKTDKIVPEGNNWSFDRENRDKFLPTQKEPEILRFKSKSRLEYLEEAITYVNSNFSKNYGFCKVEDFIYPINHEEANQWLDQFVQKKLDEFGRFEDAISSKIKFGFHSLLSAINNIGLITSRQIINKVKNYKKNIASKEGFIRQIIGWREYCYYVYDGYYDSLITNSIYTKNTKNIPKKFWIGQTNIPIIDNIIKNILSNAYSHHIERLMCVGNFLLLIGVKPEQIYFWFQTMYIDAYDVFMVPNVYGMLLYSKTDKKNHMMTRPYFCSSNYLIKMSDYKSSVITINNKVYKWDEIFDALYYNLINNYFDSFEKIYATASATKRWKNFDSNKKKHLLELSKMYTEWIYEK